MNRFIPSTKSWGLSNGIKIVWNPRVQTNSFYIDARVRFGSGHNVPSAVAHYLEHLVSFSPTKKLSTKEKLQKFLDAIGIDALTANAETSNYYTRYFEDVDYKFFQDLLLLTKERLFFSRLHKKTFIEEKNRIRDEIQERHDSPLTHFFDVMLPLQAKEQFNILTNPVGEKKDLALVTPENIVAAYQTFYNPANILLLLSGPKALGQKIKSAVMSYFQAIKNRKENSVPFLKKTSLKQGSYKVYQKRGLRQYYFSLIFPFSPFRFEDEYKIMFIYHLFQSHHSLLQRIKNVVDIYDITAGYFPLPGSALFYISGSTAHKAQVGKIMRLIRSDINHEKYRITRKQFEENRKKYTHSLLVDFESDYRTLDLIGDYYMKTGIITTPKEILRNIETIQYETMQQFLGRIFQGAKMNTFILEPK